MNRLRLLALLALVWAAPASAQDWGEIAQISTTMGVQANRLCLGEGSRGDIGCPSYAPYVSPTSGNVGFGTTNPAAPITISASFTSDMIRLGPGGIYTITALSGGGPAIYGTPYVHIGHTNGTVGAQFSTQYAGAAQLQLLPMSGQNGLLVRKGGGGSTDIAMLVSSTGSVSINAGRNEPSTTLHVSGTLRISNAGETCDADRSGAIRWHESAGQFQVCYGSGGWALLSSAATSGTTASSDRITSGTSAVIANGSANGGYISLTAGVGGTEWGYLGTSASYLPYLTSVRVSTTYASLSTVGINGGSNSSTPLIVRANGYSPTVILERSGVGSVGMSLYTDVDSGAKAFGIGWVTTSSGALSPVAGGTNFITMISDTGRVGFQHRQPSTTVDIAGTLRISNGGETCDANRSGAIRWHQSAGQFQVCYGSGGWALLSSAATSGTTATPDRIVSGTTSVIANLNGAVSTTADLDVSGTVKVAGTGSETCGPTTRGSIRQNPVTLKLEVCRY